MKSSFGGSSAPAQAQAEAHTKLTSKRPEPTALQAAHPGRCQRCPGWARLFFNQLGLKTTNFEISLLLPGHGDAFGPIRAGGDEVQESQQQS